MTGKDILAAGGCALIPAAGFGLSYFVLGWRSKGCVLAVFLSLLIAVMVLAIYIWRDQKKEEKDSNP